MQCVEDYLQGRRAPLSMVSTHIAIAGVVNG